MQPWVHAVPRSLALACFFAQALGAAGLSGTVRDPSGTALTSGTATLSGGGQRRIETIKDGLYQFTNLETARYDLLLESPGYKPATITGIQVTGHDVRVDARMSPDPPDPFVKRETSGWVIFFTVLLVLLYLLTILITRWYKIATPSRNFLLGYIDGLKDDLDADRRPPHPARGTELRARLDAIRNKYTNAKEKKYIRQFLFWSQNTENASWKAVHDVEREMAAYLTPPAAVQADLVSASARLKDLTNSNAKEIAAAIDAELNAKPAHEDLRKRLLTLATSLLLEQRDDGLISLMEWQNKATWLILVACLMLMFLAVAAGNAILFLAGAAGGMLGRMMRSLKSSNVPVDYGASWTTLFLSPLFGAFCGWFGVGIVVLLANRSVGLLGSVFTQVTWSDSLRLSTLTMAFLLGFSERLFDSLVAAVEQQATQGAAAAAPATGSSATAQVTVGANPISQPPNAAPPSPAQYDQVRQKIDAAAASAAAADHTAVTQFLVAMNQHPDPNSTPPQLAAMLAELEAFVGSDEGRRTKYVTEAQRAGFTAS